MISALLLTLLVIGILLGAGLCSGAEMGVYRLNRIRLRLRTERQNDRSARQLSALLQHPEESVLAILIAQNIFGYLLTVVTSFWLADVLHVEAHRLEFITAAILSPIVFVFGDVLPKNWLRIEADRLMYQWAGILRVIVVALRATGVVWVMQRLSRWVSRLATEQELQRMQGARGEIVGLLYEGAAEGAIDEEQGRIIERVMNLSSIRVGAIMIPRAQVKAIPLNVSRLRLERIAREQNYSRLPVLAPDERTVLGMVRLADVLGDKSRLAVKRHLQPTIAISASETAPAALVRLQQAKSAIAIVTDPRHGYVGIVTVKDIVEEIFGDLPAW